MRWVFILTGLFMLDGLLLILWVGGTQLDED
jgi:hypothetical protein